MAKNLFYGSPNKIMNFVWCNNVSATLYSIANTIFMLEKEIKSGNSRKSVSIICYVELEEKIEKEILGLIKKLVLEVFYENINFRFVKKQVKKKTKPLSLNSYETLCLYSGGIDSTLGLLESFKEYKKVLGVYVAHQDLTKVTKKVGEIYNSLLKDKGIDYIKLMAPSMGRGYSQIRGFLYIIYSTMVALFVGAKRIVVSECGVTMYQPKFAPLDTITYTTHPSVLRYAKRISELITGKRFDIILPFENFTKSEMMFLINDDSTLSKTHSCITARWGINCGLCYACITRMLGSVNLNLSLDYFKDNVFEKDSDMLISLLKFCLDFYSFKENLDYWSISNIKKYEKEELFERFCDDVFLALYNLNKKGLLNEDYKFFLERAIEFRNVNISNRKNSLLQAKRPDFSKKVL